MLVVILAVSIFYLAIVNTAKGEIDINNVSKMTREECASTTDFFIPNATDEQLGAFFNESAIHCRELLWPQPPH